MRIPNPALVPKQDVINTLRESAKKIALEDGDRDHMNPSRLTVGFTMVCARAMLLAAAKLEERR